MKLTFALLLALALSQTAAPQDGPKDCGQHADRVYTKYEVDQKAKLTFGQEPSYPESMRRKGARGRVKLQVVLRPDGRVTDIEVLETTDEEFSKASIAAAKKFKFEPAIKGGCPVAQSMIVINRYSINYYPVR